MSTHLRQRATVFVCATAVAWIFVASTAYAVDRLDGPVNVKSDAAEHPAQRLTTPGISGRPTKTDDAAERASDAKTLERRAGEKSREDPSARAMVLGMDLQEGTNGRPVVIKVGVA